MTGILGSELAEKMGFAPSQLHLFCAFEFHLSFLVWRTRLRMEEASRILLQRPELKVKEVGMLVGVFDPANFSSTFREIYGVTPLQWKNGQRASSE